jgi:catechol 2,3-dioxygenase-like lactoylglutathione lyase family enzyme
MRAGGVNLVIHPASPDTEFYPRGHCIYLDVSVADITKAKEHLLKHDISIKREWSDHNGRFLLVEDPDGNLIELIEPA